jgi:1-acyl-sn-glycerol-3-phosphate acyltransferase
VRQALYALRRKEALILFPEGEIRPPGGVGPLQRGAVWLAAKAGVPLLPVAVRVVLRGQELPEAYVVVGEPLGADLGELERSLNRMLSDLDRQLSTAPPEEPLPGFQLALPGRASTHERMAFWGLALARLTRGR